MSEGKIWFNLWVCSCGYKTEEYIGEGGIVGHMLSHAVRYTNEEAVERGAKKNLRPDEQISWKVEG